MAFMIAGFDRRTQPCYGSRTMLSTPVEPRTHVELPRFAYAHVAAVIGLALFASGTPSPLYGTYRELWGFSPVVLTLDLRDLRLRRAGRAAARRPALATRSAAGPCCWPRSGR